MLKYTKAGPLRYISHHDVMRLWDRATRRAGLPVRMTEGFNPRPRIVIPHSLALGILSESEVVEMEFYQWVKPHTLVESLQVQLPSEMKILSIQPLKPVRRASVLMGLSFDVEIPGELIEELNNAVNGFLAGKEIKRIRHSQTGAVSEVNIRPFINALSVESPGVIRMALSVIAGRTARPDEVVSALCEFAGTELHGTAKIVKTGEELRIPV